ncbi:MAG TPA: hypothetical protein VFD50_07945 [Thermoleophilia bacterium]|nr:hypothetical protein [Thermoleophilia bacterium]
MRRLSVIVGTLAVLASVVACGRSEPKPVSASSSPALGVNFDLTVPVGARRATGITLTPSHQPSGVVALQTVHDGHLTTIGSQRFRKMKDASFLVVEVSSRGVEMGWAIEGMRSSCGVAFPAGSTWAGGRYGNLTMSPGETDTAWSLTRDVGKTSTSGAGVGDASAASVAVSKKYPTETAYCVTITLER